MSSIPAPLPSSMTIGSPDLHIEDPNVVGRRWRMGVQLLIVADGAFVASLIFSYLYLRGLNTAHAWLAPHQHTAPIWVSWLITGILLVSAGLFRWGQRSIEAGNVGGFITATTLALTVLVADSVLQVAQLVTFKFGIDTSSYSSSIYTMAGANLFHLLLTIFLGVSMVNRGRVGIYSETSNWQVRIVSMWWTWIALAAVASSFATSFIASPNH
jgi:heme/copper-type cytochrome/quinol oxidase subunit 3